MKQSFANPKPTCQTGQVELTLPTLLVLVIDAADDGSGAAIPRAPWGLCAAVETVEEALGSAGRRLFASAKRPGRGVTAGALQPLVDTLLATGFVEPVGVGWAACWRIAADRREEVDALWLSVDRTVTSAARTAGQRVAATAVALSKTVRPSVESSLATS